MSPIALAAIFVFGLRHVDETRVMDAVRALKLDHMKFPQPLESIIKPSADAVVTKEIGRNSTPQGNQQGSSDRHDQKICHFKRLSETAGQPGQPLEKRLKKNDENSYDREYDKDSGDVEDVKSWKEFYKRSVSEDTRIAYLSEFFKFLQTVNGGGFKEDEALENTCHVLKMMEALERGGHTIDCLLDRLNIWDWVEPRIETKLSVRTLQKYLFSLEKFYDFISCCRLPAYLPQFSEKTKSVAKRLACVCPHWRRKVGQIACIIFPADKFYNEDTRIAYLSEFFKFLQTVNGGGFKEDEALENTCHVLKMMEALERGGHTIDCLLDRLNIWDWVEPRIETKLSVRTLQKYLFSLEKFYNFISCCRLPAYLPQFSEKTKGVASRLACVCPHWRRIVGQIACERRCNPLLVDPVNPCSSFPADAGTSFTLTQSVLGEHSRFTETSSNESKMQGSASMWPRRKKWRNEDVELLLTHFKRNPGKAAIRRKMRQDEQLEELVKREGLNRCYEKVKSLYKEKK